MFNWFKKEKKENYKNEIDTLEIIFANKIIDFENAIQIFINGSGKNFDFKLYIKMASDNIKNKYILMYTNMLNNIKERKYFIIKYEYNCFLKTHKFFIKLISKFKEFLTNPSFEGLVKLKVEIEKLKIENEKKL